MIIATTTTLVSFFFVIVNASTTTATFLAATFYHHHRSRRRHYKAPSLSASATVRSSNLRPQPQNNYQIYHRSSGSSSSRRLKRTFSSSSKMSSTTSTTTKMSTSSDFENKAKEFWDERYASSQDQGGKYTFGLEPNDYLKEIYDTVLVKSFGTSSDAGEKKKVLMLGEGEGRNGVFLAKQGGYDVTAVDISNVGLEKAQTLAKENGVTITTIHEDLKTHDFGVEQWDLIVSIFCHLPPLIRHKVLHEDICKSLKRGGYFLLEGYTPEQLTYKTGGPPSADMMYTSKILDEAFPVDSSPLETLKNVEMVRDVVEGTAHTGKASVVQYLGQKKNMA